MSILHLALEPLDLYRYITRQRQPRVIDSMEDLTDGWTSSQMDRQTDKQMDRPTDRQINRIKTDS